ncbi:hypothetical protein ACQKWADRAFT_312514 [Trichoderma austrokoningii]
MAPQDKKWDDAAERDLCMAMIFCNTESGRARQNWPRIEEVMKSLEYSFTRDAMSQHYSKTIMKDFKKRIPSLIATAPTDTPSPAKARKTKAAGKGDATPSKKRAKKTAAVAPKDDEDDDTEVDATPSKRVKKEDKATPVKKEEAVKEEEAADVDATETADDEKDKAFQDWAAKGLSDEE